MVKVKIQAEGIGDVNRAMSLTHELELVDGIYFNIDENEETVEINFEDEVLPRDEILHFFKQAGIKSPEFIGDIPPEIQDIDIFE